MKVALLQTPVVFDKEQNVKNACARVREAALEGARLAVLPEMFCCPYSTQYFADYAEPAGGPVWQALSRCAAENRICLVAGSMPELENGRVYNTSFVFGPDGRQLARHRKMHLFDVEFDGGQHFRESDTFTPGEDVTTFDFDGITFGLCICFDFRFPELSRLMALRGAQVTIVPAAFNMTTGPAHWELSFRMRALDNQVFMIGCAPARDMESSYTAWGHSMVTDPWGFVIDQLDETEGILTVELDMTRVDTVRQQLPLLKHRRTDLYDVPYEATIGRTQRNLAGSPLAHYYNKE